MCAVVPRHLARGAAARSPLHPLRLMARPRHRALSTPAKHAPFHRAWRRSVPTPPQDPAQTIASPLDHGQRRSPPLEPHQACRAWTRPGGDFGSPLDPIEPGGRLRSPSCTSHRAATPARCLTRSLCRLAKSRPAKGSASVRLALGALPHNAASKGGSSPCSPCGCAWLRSRLISLTLCPRSSPDRQDCMSATLLDGLVYRFDEMWP